MIMIYNDHRAKHTSCVRLAELQCSDGQGYHFRRHRCSYFVPAKLQSIHSHLQDLETQPPSLPLLASPSTYMTCARITPSLITASPPNPDPLTSHRCSPLTAHKSPPTHTPRHTPRCTTLLVNTTKARVRRRVACAAMSKNTVDLTVRGKGRRREKNLNAPHTYLTDRRRMQSAIASILFLHGSDSDSGAIR